jgi:hypothetical protein
LSYFFGNKKKIKERQMGTKKRIKREAKRGKEKEKVEN